MAKWLFIACLLFVTTMPSFGNSKPIKELVYRKQLSKDCLFYVLSWRILSEKPVYSNDGIIITLRHYSYHLIYKKHDSLLFNAPAEDFPSSYPGFKGPMVVLDSYLDKDKLYLLEKNAGTCIMLVFGNISKKPIEIVSQLGFLCHDSDAHELFITSGKLLYSQQYGVYAELNNTNLGMLYYRFVKNKWMKTEKAKENTSLQRRK